MKLTLEDLLNNRPSALKARMMAQSQYAKINGTKPRAEEETKALAILTINRVRKAMAEKRWVLKEGVRRIEYRSN